MWQTLREEESTDSVSMLRTVREKHAPLHYFMGCTKRRQFHSMPATNTVNTKKFSTGQYLHGGILCATALMNEHSKRSRGWLKNQSGSHIICGQQVEIYSTARMEAKVKHLRTMWENHWVYHSSKKRTYFKKQTRFLCISSGTKISTD